MSCTLVGGSEEGGVCVRVCACLTKERKRWGTERGMAETGEAGSVLLNNWSPSLPMACILEPNHILSVLAEKAPDCSSGICIIYLNFITL